VARDGGVAGTPVAAPSAPAAITGTNDATGTAPATGNAASTPKPP